VLCVCFLYYFVFGFCKMGWVKLYDIVLDFV